MLDDLADGHVVAARHRVRSPSPRRRPSGTCRSGRRRRPEDGRVDQHAVHVRSVERAESRTVIASPPTSITAWFRDTVTSLRKMSRAGSRPIDQLGPVEEEALADLVALLEHESRALDPRIGPVSATGCTPSTGGNDAVGLELRRRTQGTTTARDRTCSACRALGHGAPPRTLAVRNSTSGEGERRCASPPRTRRRPRGSPGPARPSGRSGGCARTGRAGPRSAAPVVDLTDHVLDDRPRSDRR